MTISSYGNSSLSGQGQLLCQYRTYRTGLGKNILSANVTPQNTTEIDWNLEFGSCCTFIPKIVGYNLTGGDNAEMRKVSHHGGKRKESLVTWS